MPLSNDALKQQLASRAHATSSGVAPASGGAPPAGGPQGVFDVSNDGINWHPAVRLTASTGTAFVVTNGEAVLTGQNAGMVEYADHATFRASPAPADGAVFRIISPPGEFRYSSSTGAGWADDDDTLLKPASVNVNSNGRAYSTRASEHAATFAAFRAMKGLLGRAKHVHVESHTTFGDGGGGIFDVKPVGSYVDNNGTVLVNGTAAGVRRTNLGEPILVDWFGPVTDGSADASVAVAAAHAAGKHIKFSDGKTYRIDNRVFFAGDDVTIECGRATIVNNGPQHVFYMGAIQDTYKCSRFRLTGGHFKQADPTTSEDRNYLMIASIRDFEVSGCVFDNVSDAGIYVTAGSENGRIHHIQVHGNTSWLECRAVLLGGSTASDYAPVLVDEESISRNAVAIPVYAVKNVTVSDSEMSFVSGYGVYGLNTRDCAVANCQIDIGPGHRRAICAHNYSPGFRVTGCTIRSSSHGTGVLVAQNSHDVVIANNTFLGDFGQYRAVVISTLSTATVTGNVFANSGQQDIYVCMGAFADIRCNSFIKSSARTTGDRAVWLTATDQTQPTNLVIGRTATVLDNSGVVFEQNTLSGLAIGVDVETHHAADNGNQPAVGIAKCSGNTFLGLIGASANEYPMVITAGAGANVTQVRYNDNVVTPYTSGDRNRYLVKAGTAYATELTDTPLALFEVDNAASGGAITAAKISGDNYAVTVARDGDSLVLRPRTQNGAFGEIGALSPTLVSVTDAAGATPVHGSKWVSSEGDYLVDLFDSAGTAIPLSTAAATVRVLLAAPKLDWSAGYSADWYVDDLVWAVGGIANIKTLVIADDVPGSVGDDVSSIPVRIGSTLALQTAGKAKIGLVNSRRCVVFAEATNSTYLAAVVGSGANALVAQYTGSVPSTGPSTLCYDPSGGSSLYVPSAGVPYWSAPVVIDDTSSNTLDNEPHTIIRNTAVAGNSVLGGVTGANPYNFVGNVWSYVQTVASLTTEQLRRLHMVNRRRYPFLGA